MFYVPEMIHCKVDYKIPKGISKKKKQSSVLRSKSLTPLTSLRKLYIGQFTVILFLLTY
jgi:uncharacterized protein YeaO (DUF488 family)